MRNNSKQTVATKNTSTDNTPETRYMELSDEDAIRVVGAAARRPGAPLSVPKWVPPVQDGCGYCVPPEPPLFAVPPERSFEF